MITKKTIPLNRGTFFGKVMSLLFNILPSLVHSFSSKGQASFNFMAAVTICSDPSSLFRCPFLKLAQQVKKYSMGANPLAEGWAEPRGRKSILFPTPG